MEREKVIDIVLNASTWEECQQARNMLSEWMQTHPDDWSMLDAGEALEMTMDGLEPSNTIIHEVSRQAAI